MLLEHAQDLVAQDLDLPHGAVAAVDGNRPVAGGVGRDGRVGFAVPQLENVPLNERQERAALRCGEILTPAGGLGGGEQLYEFAPHRSERGQQAIAAFEMQRSPVGSGVPFCQAADRALGKNFAPVLAAGVEKKEIDPHQVGQAFECLQVARREVRHPEQRDPFREQGRPIGPAGEFVQAILPEPGAVASRGLVQPPPQAGLPTMVGVDVDPPAVPFQKQVRPEHRVLVIQPGQAAGELVALELPGVIREIVPQRPEVRVVQSFGQDAHDPERESIGFESDSSLFFRVKPPEDVVQKRIREREARVGADAVEARELHGDPAFHAPALDHDDLGGQRVRERLAQGLGQAGDQRFRAVAGVDVESGHGRNRSLQGERVMIQLSRWLPGWQLREGRSCRVGC